jgi:hypothetical protein
MNQILGNTLSFEAKAEGSAGQESGLKLALQLQALNLNPL